MTSSDKLGRRSQQREWRARLPEAERIVEHVSPALLKDALARRANDIPQEWLGLVATMGERVASSALAEQAADEANRDSQERRPGAPSGMKLTQRKGYAWSHELDRVRHMIMHLLRRVLDDIGFEKEASLGSFLLVERALLYAELELQDGGTESGREDSEENQFRVVHALRCISPHFDDLNMRRFRALRVAEFVAKLTSIPSAESIEDNIALLRAADAIPQDDEQEHRDYLAFDQPAMRGVFGRQLLAEVDETFAALDPLVVLEEFDDADAIARGGRSSNGDGRIGPARALARLSLMSGALEFKQEPGEDFEMSVDRARRALLSNRSRMRRTLRRTLEPHTEPGA